MLEERHRKESDIDIAMIVSCDMFDFAEMFELHKEITYIDINNGIEDCDDWVKLDFLVYSHETAKESWLIKEGEIDFRNIIYSKRLF